MLSPAPLLSSPRVVVQRVTSSKGAFAPTVTASLYPQKTR